MKLTSIQQQVKKAFKIGNTLFLTAIAICLLHFESTAQATLSIQGILKKSNGVALDDGTYKLTFRIYPAGSPPSTSGALWTEEIPDVDLNGGIYSVILGKITPLGLTFSDVYELGVQVESSPEMSPRLELTSAPYALALRGTTNQFPSSGQVLADRVRVAQGVTANTGAPLVNNVDGSKGYSFNGDNDSGVFSTQDGKVSIYTNGVERYRANTSGTYTVGNDTVVGTVGANNIILYNNGNINYSSTNGSFNDWRLVDLDDFNVSAHDGWQQYINMFSSQTDQSSNLPGLIDYGVFNGNVLRPNINSFVLKKEYTIPGTWTQMKIKFKYFFIDSWDANQGDRGVAGFASNASGSNFRMAWGSIQQVNQSVYGSDISGDANFFDYSNDVEITGRRNGSSNSFWLFIGAFLNETNETYAIGPVEVWVK